MSKYGRLLVRHLMIVFGGIGASVLVLGGIGAMACHQNTAWNCDVPVYLANLAADPEIFAPVLLFLAAPFWTAALDVPDEGSHLIIHILWPVFGFLFAAAMWAGMLAAYMRFLEW